MAKKRELPTRSSKWCFITYEDDEFSMIDKILLWKRVYLDYMRIGFAISPLHAPESDVEGVEKKRHYHIVLDYGSLKSFEQVSRDIDMLVKADKDGKREGVTNPFVIANFRSMCRYLIHLDDSKKQQFSDEEVKFSSEKSSINLEKYWVDEISDDIKDEILTECENLILSGEVMSYNDLLFRFHESKFYRMVIRKNCYQFNVMFKDVLYLKKFSDDKKSYNSKSAEYSKADNVGEYFLSQAMAEKSKNMTDESKKNLETKNELKSVFDIF